MDYLLDPELAAVAGALPKVDLADLASARETERLLFTQLPKYQAGTPLTVQDVVVGEHHGAEVPVRIYAPASRSAPGPALLYLHAGAYVMGGLPAADVTAPMLVEQAGVTVVAVDYRLAPEHPYPAGLDDSYAALQWVAERGKEFGIDPDRIGVLGESAGGGLAAALAMLTRDRQGPRLTAQILDAPTVDDRLDTPSMTTLVDTPSWQSVNSPPTWRYYLQGTAEPGSAEVPLYAAPARATVDDLAGLPPAFVTAYQVDPTRDEGLDYARMLIQAGVPTEVHHYSNAFHMAHIVPGTTIGARMMADRIAAIRRMLDV
ncbi:esterase [Mycobacterium saskatchewanense]|uniref:Esterase n=1 Tax=Mycobacterium saskatchewanense TaxID=220927 RepID=A0AAJ3NUN3_9MYCO|nr:alpha/beta hydrolase [Mycobacterium saskatchewanense]ORW74073.1 esterase [Mycobacterium saskatchewanense]BBX65641.1 esterase [Mycobacterium saskatchewanense]